LVRQYLVLTHPFSFIFAHFLAVLRIRIRMNPHDFGLLDPHPESAFQMRIPDADADPGKIAPMIKKNLNF
jgi:hypothetical protein